MYQLFIVFFENFFQYRYSLQFAILMLSTQCTFHHKRYVRLKNNVLIILAPDITFIRCQFPVDLYEILTKMQFILIFTIWKRYSLLEADKLHKSWNVFNKFVMSSYLRQFKEASSKSKYGRIVHSRLDDYFNRANIPVTPEKMPCGILRYLHSQLNGDRLIQKQQRPRLIFSQPFVIKYYITMLTKTC